MHIEKGIFLTHFPCAIVFDQENIFYTNKHFDKDFNIKENYFGKNTVFDLSIALISVPCPVFTTRGR